MRLLIVKTSSMGDVVHALPTVSDIAQRFPQAELHWLVEPAFAALPALHPFVRKVLPLPWRKWRKSLGRRATWTAMAALRSDLRSAPYDLVLDLQGIVMKSVLWGAQARGPLAGYDRHSIREPLAALFYSRRSAVSRELHAVERCRRLAALLLGYAAPDDAPDFGIRPPPPSWPAPPRYAVLIPSASRDDKLWPEPHWIALGRKFTALGWTPVLLWGNPAERSRAQRIADACAGVLPPFLPVHDMAAVLAGAQVVVGLDTGFSHLAAAFGVPTLGIYCDHEPGLAGIVGPGWVRSIGGTGQRPSLEAVQALVDEEIAYSSSMRRGG